LSTGIQERALDLGLFETGPTNKQGAGVPLMQPAAPAQPQGVSAGAMSMPGLQYPVRTGGPFAPLQGEETDREIGLKYVNSLINAQPEMKTAKRNLQEVIKKATEIEQNALVSSTGVLGAAERKIRGAAGDTSFQQLSKDLAQLQMSVIQAKGGSLDTVAGQGLARAANGDVTYAPSVIRDIARRTYGDVVATEAEGAAADLFRKRFGEANHSAFKQIWSKNSDSRVFELMGLEDLVQDPKEQERVAKEIVLKGLSPKQIDELTKKYRNIKRLRETGSL
jgi:SOS response regulatory protein OraA/RecX